MFLGQQYLSLVVDVVRFVGFRYLFKIFACFLSVATPQRLMNFVGERDDGAWREAECQFDGCVGLVVALLRLIVVGNLRQLVSVHEHGHPHVHGVFVFRKHLTEFLAVEILVVQFSIFNFQFPLLVFCVPQTDGAVEDRLFGC